MEGVNPLQETFLLGTFKVGLPTFDVYSDIALTAKLYIGHPIYASSLFIPFFINYALGWRAWYYGDMKNHNNKQRKRFAWIFALLGCYPQLVALRIIHLFWKRPNKGIFKKKHLERNVMENEVFSEAVPTTFIMTFLMVVLVFTGEDEEARILAGATLLPISGRFLFFATFSTSALSAGLGLAKCLKVG